MERSWADNHTVFEVEDGNRILHFDTDTQAYYLMHDNWTVASSQDIRDDAMLVQRAVHYRNYVKYPVGANDTETDIWVQLGESGRLVRGSRITIPYHRMHPYMRNSKFY